MNKQAIYGEGVSGVRLELNHSEMVVLKGFADQADDVVKKDKEEIDVSERSIDLLKDIAIFIRKALPKDVMSLDEAYQELFKEGEQSESV